MIHIPFCLKNKNIRMVLAVAAVAVCMMFSSIRPAHAFPNYLVGDYWSCTYEPTLCSCQWNYYKTSRTCKCKDGSLRTRTYYYNYIPATSSESHSEGCSCGNYCSGGEQRCTRIYKYVYKPEADRFNFTLIFSGMFEDLIVRGESVTVTIEAWDNDLSRVVADRLDGARSIAGYRGTCRIDYIEESGNVIPAAEITFTQGDAGVKTFTLPAYTNEDYSGVTIRVTDKNYAALLSESALISVKPLLPTLDEVRFKANINAIIYLSPACDGRAYIGTVQVGLCDADEPNPAFQPPGAPPEYCLLMEISPYGYYRWFRIHDAYEQKWVLKITIADDIQEYPRLSWEQTRKEILKGYGFTEEGTFQLWKSDSEGNLVESGLRVSDMRATHEYQMTWDDGSYMAIVWTWPAMP